MREEDRPMKSSRYSLEQVAFGLRQAEDGVPVAEVCRNMGISEQTLYRWKKSSKAWVLPRCVG
ncbi:MAG: transposase [Chloroflexi bacterium]|nr:transposase [Chloroflexota bacterium]